MRNSLLLVVGLASLSLVACGDAAPSEGGGIERKPTTTTAPPGGDDGQPSVGENDKDPGNPNANPTPPTPPVTPGKTTGEIGVAVTPATMTAGLGSDTELTVTIEPKAGFKGNAVLSVAGLPTGATGTFTPASVTLNTTAMTAKLLIKVPVTAVPSAAGGSSALVVSAKADGKEASANASFKVTPTLKLTIPVNIDALRSTGTKFVDQWGPAFGATPQALKTQAGNGIVVTVFNADSKAHIVHGNAGFAHGSTTLGQEVQPNAFELQNGAPRTRTFLPGANVNGYPHDGAAGASAGFRISVVAAP